MSTTTSTGFAVTGMSCGHCENAIRTEVSGVPGVSGVEVSAETGLLTVTGEAPLQVSAVLAAVEEAGYEATAR